MVLMVSFSSRISPLTSTVILRLSSPRATAVVTSAKLRSEVTAHGVDGVGQVFPRSRHAGHRRLHTEPALGADLARHAGDFRCERAQLLDHRIDCFLEL